MLPQRALADFFPGAARDYPANKRLSDGGSKEKAGHIKYPAFLSLPA
jgi:hypothetical protein